MNSNNSNQQQFLPSTTTNNINNENLIDSTHKKDDLFSIDKMTITNNNFAINPKPVSLLLLSFVLG